MRHPKPSHRSICGPPALGHKFADPFFDFRRIHCSIIRFSAGGPLAAFTSAVVALLLLLAMRNFGSKNKTPGRKALPAAPGWHELIRLRDATREAIGRDSAEPIL